MANKISVIIDATVDKAVGGLKAFKSAVGEADGAFGKLKAGGTSAFDTIKQNAVASSLVIGTAVVGMAAKAIGAASDLAEATNAVEVTFGPMADGIKKLGKEAAESVGLSNAEFDGLAVQFAAFATTIAGEKGDIVGTIDEMTTRVADFASVMNLDVPEAARIFQSALAGETEPIKKFGLDLSAAAVEAHAVEMGILGVDEKMTAAKKTQATYSLLMQETDKFSGDFLNTSDGLANSQRILKAKVEDAAAALGNTLVPVLAEVVTGLSAVVDVAAPTIGALGGIVDKAQDVAYEIGSFFGKLATPFTDGILPEQTLKDLEDIEAGIDAVFEEMSAGAGTMDEFVARIDKAGITGYEKSLLILKFRDSIAAADESTGTFTGSLLENAAALIEQTTQAGAVDAAMIALKGAVDDQRDAQEKAKEKAKEHTEALEDQIAATDDLFSAKQALVGGDIAVRDSQRQAAEAVAALNLLTDEGKASAEEFGVAQDGAAQSLIDAASAAADYQIAQSESNGETLSGESKTNLFKLKLQELASTLAPGSELRTMIEGYIADLAAIPTNIDTRVTLIGGDLLGGVNGKRAAGGPVSAGQSYLVGEQGMELFTPAMNGYITPHSAVAAGWGSGSSSAAAGDTYAPVVNNNGRDFTVADMSRALTLARLSR